MYLQMLTFKVVYLLPYFRALDENPQKNKINLLKIFIDFVFIKCLFVFMFNFKTVFVELILCSELTFTSRQNKNI